MWGRSAQRTVLIAAAEPRLPGLLPDFLRHGGISTIVRPLDDVEALVRCVKDGYPAVLVDDARATDSAGALLCRRLRADPLLANLPIVLVGPACPSGLSVDALVSTPIVMREYFDALRRFVPLPRRRHLRHAINLRFEYDHGGVRGQAFSRDLSSYGAFLKTDRPIPEGDVIAVEFHLPGERAVIATGAVVRRCAPYDPATHGMAGLAIEFVGMADDDLERLAAFVERHLPPSRLGFRRSSAR